MQTLREFSPRAIAEQLTLESHEQLTAINDEEFENLRWQKRDKEATAPNILRSIARFGRISSYVNWDVLRCAELQNRAGCLRYYILVMHELQALRNKNDLIAVCAALHSTSIHRLKRTWEVLPPAEAEYVKIVGQLHQAAGRQPQRCPDGSELWPLREDSDGKPMIPYLGMLLTDLTFLHEGLADATVRRQRSDVVIKTFRDSLSVGYEIERNDAIRFVLGQLDHAHSEPDLYQLSLEAEPRRPSNAAAASAALPAKAVAKAESNDTISRPLLGGGDVETGRKSAAARELGRPCVSRYEMAAIMILILLAAIGVTVVVIVRNS